MRLGLALGGLELLTDVDLSSTKQGRRWVAMRVGDHCRAEHARLTDVVLDKEQGFRPSIAKTRVHVTTLPIHDVRVEVDEVSSGFLADETVESIEDIWIWNLQA